MLDEWLKTHKRSRPSLAAEVGVSAVSIWRICKGVQRPTPELAAKLERVTGIAAWEFLKPKSE